jgi:hypothetical protein
VRAFVNMAGVTARTPPTIDRPNIRPENILYRGSDPDSDIVIVDFGMYASDICGHFQSIS